MTNTYLIELSTEELPPKSLKTIALSFYENIISELNKNNIKYKNILWFATPRRLAIKIKDIIIPKEIINTYKGPSIINSYNKKGQPTQAMTCWMKKFDIQENQITTLKTEKGEWIICKKIMQHNESISNILKKVSNLAIKKISIPTFMKWNSENSRFSRPVRNIIMLIDNKIIPNKIFGLKTSRFTTGHIFLTKKKIKILHAKQYPEILLTHGKVIADYEQRKNKIKESSKLIVQSIGGMIKFTHTLLEEITSLVEWPQILIATFNKKFLILPHELLINIMEKQQRCVPIYDKTNKKLINYFIIIANIETFSHTNNKVIKGNEQVINAKFTDAEFFLKKDTKKPLQDYQPLLKNIIFYNSLGSMLDKTNRIKKLIQFISKYSHANLKHCIRAAHLSKCDLITNIVFEYPEIQGKIGMHYALNSNEHYDVALAIKEQYQPRFSKDKLPSNSISYSLSLADKIDTLIGLFSIIKNHKGNKDPFALRRLAIGIIRIITEKKILIDFKDLIKQTLNIYKIKNNRESLTKNIILFVFKKIYSIYNEKYHNSIIKSILKCQPTNLVNIDARIKAISHVKKQPFILQRLVQTNKRILNILNKSNLKLYKEINTTFLNIPIEIDLTKTIYQLKNKTNTLYSKEQCVLLLLKLNKLCTNIELFFNQVKINDKNLLFKINRLTILKTITDLFLNIANFSYL